MRKKILFIISNLETGGVSKSMTSLLNVIDRERYDVSLMVTSPHGAFMELLPADLRIITNPAWQAVVSGPAGIINLLKMGKPLLAIGHVARLALSSVNKAWAGRMIARLMPGIDEEFDTVVDFNGQHQLYFMADKLKARKKVTFFHNDYTKWPYYYSADKKYYAKVDNIFTVSQQCVDSLKKYFPEQDHKIGLMENISSVKLIDKLSEAPAPEITMTNVFLTVGHVCERKGSSWAIEAASILKKRGIDFHWYFLGFVTDEPKYTKLVNDLDVADRITFLGIKVNPYPYLKKAKLIVHPSRFEGKSVALDEAKLLCKPVVVTNFSTVHDQFEDRINASICEMKPASIADAIEELINDSELRERYISNLEATRQDNSSEINKLYAIFE